jgi:hypothetical protein
MVAQTDWRLDNWGSFSDTDNDEIFFILTTVFRLALGPTPPPMQWIWGTFSLRGKVARVPS